MKRTQQQRIAVAVVTSATPPTAPPTRPEGYYKTANKKNIKRAAREGDLISQHNLAFRYQQQNNLEKMVKWVSIAAHQGYPPAQAHLGLLLLEGKGLEANHRKAAKWLKLAAERRDFEGMEDWKFLYELGQIYRYGSGGVEADPIEAVKWYTRCAKVEENKCSCLALGEMYLSGAGPLLLQDGEKALKYYMKYDQKGDDCEVKHIIGKIYEKGVGVEKDRSKAIEWFTKASPDNNRSAYRLAKLYFESQPRDINKGMQYMKLAAEGAHGLLKAQFFLGNLYYQGQEIREDWEEAEKWFRLAANKDHLVATEKLGEILIAKEDHLCKGLHMLCQAVNGFDSVRAGEMIQESLGRVQLDEERALS